MVRVLSPPAVEPVSLEEIKLYTRADETDTAEDGLLQTLIAAAREYCEKYQNRAYITQTLELVLNAFPWCRRDVVRSIELPRGSLQTVDSITYTDASGVDHIMDPDSYIILPGEPLGQIAPVGAWPADALRPVDPIRIQYKAGYGDTADKVPARVRQAIQMLCVFWYDNRSAVAVGTVSVKLDFSVKALLAPDRIVVV